MPSIITKLTATFKCIAICRFQMTYTGYIASTKSVKAARANQSYQFAAAQLDGRTQMHGLRGGLTALEISNSLMDRGIPTHALAWCSPQISAVLTLSINGANGGSVDEGEHDYARIKIIALLFGPVNQAQKEQCD
jgi:hypothetical protein